MRHCHRTRIRNDTMPSLQRALRRLLMIPAALLAAAAAAADRPHVIYITVDDLGWKDIGYHGSTV